MLLNLLRIATTIHYIGQIDRQTTTMHLYADHDSKKKILHYRIHSCRNVQFWLLNAVMLYHRHTHLCLMLYMVFYEFGAYAPFPAPCCTMCDHYLISSFPPGLSNALESHTSTRSTIIFLASTTGRLPWLVSSSFYSRNTQTHKHSLCPIEGPA